MAPKLASRVQHDSLVLVFAFLFAWHFNHWAHFFARRCDTLATWPSSLPQEVQHGVQVGTQEVERSPASPQVGPLRCNMVPTGTQVGPEIPTMAPESADLGHLGAVSGRSWAVLGRSVGKVKMRGSWSGKNGPE